MEFLCVFRFIAFLNVFCSEKYFCVYIGCLPLSAEFLVLEYAFLLYGNKNIENVNCNKMGPQK